MNPLSKEDMLPRWRLVLGKEAEQCGIGCGADSQAQRIEKLVGFLFDGSPADADGKTDDRRGGKEDSRLTVPEWVDQVQELFPRQAKEVLERELVRRRGIRDLMEQPELLERSE